MSEIVIYRVVIVGLLILLSFTLILLVYYVNIRNRYKRDLVEFIEVQNINNSHKRDNTKKMEEQILLLKSLISRLIFIINGKPAILCNDRLRFTYSVRANGKRVARVKPLGDKEKTTTVIGESMVEIEKGKYIHLDKLQALLTKSKEYPYTSMEEGICNIKQYNVPSLGLVPSYEN